MEYKLKLDDYTLDDIIDNEQEFYHFVTTLELNDKFKGQTADTDTADGIRAHANWLVSAMKLMRLALFSGLITDNEYVMWLMYEQGIGFDEEGNAIEEYEDGTSEIMPINPHPKDTFERVLNSIDGHLAEQQEIVNSI